jgi:hypothetical protein
VPFLRWSFWRLAIGARNISKTGQIGDGREAGRCRLRRSPTHAGATSTT